MPSENDQIFIALTGTIGSGKNCVSEYLISKYGFSFAAGSNIIAAEAVSRGIPVTRENMRAIANEMRAQDGNALIDRTIGSVSSSSRALIGFLRTENEIKRLRETQPNAILIAINAPKELRYKRIVKRNQEKDQVTFEEFVNSEEIEMHSENPNEQNVGYCIEHADIVITNDSSLDDLYAKIDTIINI